MREFEEIYYFQILETRWERRFPSDDQIQFTFEDTWSSVNVVDEIWTLDRGISALFYFTGDFHNNLTDEELAEGSVLIWER